MALLSAADVRDAPGIGDLPEKLTEHLEICDAGHKACAHCFFAAGRQIHAFSLSCNVICDRVSCQRRISCTTHFHC